MNGIVSIGSFACPSYHFIVLQYYSRTGHEVVKISLRKSAVGVHVVMIIN